MNPIPRPLYELCLRHVEQRDPREQPDATIRYIDIGSVSNRTKQIETWKEIKGREASVRARQVVKAGDVLVSTVRPNLNAVALVDSELDGAICSTGFCVLRCGPELSPGFLFAYVQSQEFVESLVDLVQGALYPAVTDRQVLSQLVPWVEFGRQQQLARSFQDQFLSLANAKTAARMQLAELDLLPQKLLGQGKTRRRYLLGEVLVEVKDGIGSKWADFPVLGATRAGLAPAKEQPGKHAARYKPVDAGTVFYNPMRILIGSIAFVDEEDGPGITSPDYVVLKGKQGVVDSRWFYYWLRSPWGEQCIQSLARGAVRERMLFNRLAEGEIELPDYDSQVKASRAMWEIKPLRTAIQTQLAELELLPQKLLAQVFGN